MGTNLSIGGIPPSSGVIAGDKCPSCRKGKLEPIVKDEDTFSTHVICPECRSIFPIKDVWKIKVGQL